MRREEWLNNVVKSFKGKSLSDAARQHEENLSNLEWKIYFFESYSKDRNKETMSMFLKEWNDKNTENFRSFFDINDVNDVEKEYKSGFISYDWIDFVSDIGNNEHECNINKIQSIINDYVHSWENYILPNVDKNYQLLLDEQEKIKADKKKKDEEDRRIREEQDKADKAREKRDRIKAKKRSRRVCKKSSLCKLLTVKYK